MRGPFFMTSMALGAAALALGACAESRVERSRAPAIATGERAPVAGGIVRHGDSFAMMSEQYGPRAGPYVATGASAWVRPAPAPAFVAAGTPPRADPAPPDPIEAAINQSTAAARAEAAAPAEAAVAPRDPAVRAAGLSLFRTFACGTCHAFADAGASGTIGPALDRNPRLTRAFAINVIGHGAGAMPSFAGQMSEAEIAALADYLVAFARK